MATPPSDDTRMLFKLLVEKGRDDWHPYEQVRDELAATVPPGRALRKYEERLEASRRFHKAGTPAPPPAAELTEDEKIFYGQRAFAQITISSWKGRGVIQRVENDKKEIKIKPGFRSWGVAEVSVPHQTGQESVGPTDPPRRDSEPSESPPRVPDAPVAGDFVAQALAVTPEPITVVQQPAEGREKHPAEKVADMVAEVSQRESDFQAQLRSFELPKRTSPTVTVEAPAECSICGLAVANRERHDQWHAEQKRPEQVPEMALLDQAALRTLLGDVMGQGLDRFQEGLQHWLQTQFAQLEASIGAHRPLPQRWATGSVYTTHRE